MDPFSDKQYCTGESIRLSKVLFDIGANDEMVTVRRNTGLVMENMDTIKDKVCGNNLTYFYFGSQTEGTTIPGIGSDRDKLSCFNRVCVVQNEIEAIDENTFYLLMVQDATTAPGYCKLQRLSGDLPFVDSDVLCRHSFHDSLGRVFVTNTLLNDDLTRRKELIKHGPASTNETFNQDFVNAFACSSIPDGVSIHELSTEISDVFVVPAGCVQSENEKLEWRISTSLSERKFMFSLNISQIRCYIMLKVIKKTFIESQLGDMISSFMCKTILMHLVSKTKRTWWTEENLILSLCYCLRMLRKCVIMKKCPHFFYRKNNLMFGKIDLNSQKKLIEILDHLLADIYTAIVQVQIDNIGVRLTENVQKVNEPLFRKVHNELLARKFAFEHLTATLITKAVLSSDDPIYDMKDKFMHVLQIQQKRQAFEEDAANLIHPILCANLGSMVASKDLSQGKRPSMEAFALFSKAIDDGNDYTHGKLKLASAIYSFGHVYDGVDIILNELENDLTGQNVQTVCNCRSTEPWVSEWKFHDELYKKEVRNTARPPFVCGLLFTRMEMNCVPRELKFEMYRCTKNELKERDDTFFYWSDWAVVDTLPHLNFLKFKTYGKLGMAEKQDLALRELSRLIQHENRLFHRDTALNLLGQCCEDKRLYLDAFICYFESIGQQSTHNAARWLVVLLLWKMYVTTDYLKSRRYEQTIYSRL